MKINISRKNKSDSLGGHKITYARIPIPIFLNRNSLELDLFHSAQTYPVKHGGHIRRIHTKDRESIEFNSACSCRFIEPEDSNHEPRSRINASDRTLPPEYY